MQRLWKSVRIKVLFFVVSLLFLSPQLGINYPGLIDDGSDFLIAGQKSFVSLLGSELFFESRTWPLRLFFKKILFTFFGVEIHFHYFAYAFFLACLLFLFYKLIKKENVKDPLALLFTLSLLAFPGFVSNFYRLGTAEHFQTILLLGSLILLEKRPIFSILLAGGSLLVKETQVFYNILYLYYFGFLKKNKKAAFLVFGTLSLMGMVVGLKLLLLDDPYLDQFTLKATNLIEVVKYAPITAIYFFGLLVFASLVFLKKLKVHPSVSKYLVFSFFFLPPFFLWRMYNNYYYHLPMQVLLSVSWVGLLQHHFLKQKALRAFLVPLLLFFCSIYSFSFLTSFKIGRIMHLVALEDSSLVSFVLHNRWNGFRVYTTLSGFENVTKLDSYFASWNSSPPQSFYPSMSDWYSINFSDTFLLSELTKSAEPLYEADLDDRKIMIGSRSELPVGVPPPVDSKDICGSSFYVKNHCIYYYRSPIDNLSKD